jgi:vacuolar-type H+-ATPase subunit H
LSGIEAVRKIVETEAQAKRIVEEAESRAQEILDVETDSLLENYKKLFENRKDAAAKKAVELILGG